MTWLIKNIMGRLIDNKSNQVSTTLRHVNMGNRTFVYPVASTEQDVCRRRCHNLQNVWQLIVGKCSAETLWECVLNTWIQGALLYIWTCQTITNWKLVKRETITTFTCGVSQQSPLPSFLHSCRRAPSEWFPPLLFTSDSSVCADGRR